MGILGDGPNAKKPSRRKYKTSTIRQFDGGWNVIDNEINLSPRFAVVLDNLVRSTDGSLTIRPGYVEELDIATGVETTRGGPYSIAYSNGSRRAIVTFPAHGLVSGNHFSFEGLSGDFGNIPASDHVDIRHSVRVINANSFDIILTGAPTSGGTVTTTGTVITDTHAGAPIVNGFFYQRRLFVVTEAGEILCIDEDHTITNRWSNPVVYSLPGNPVGWGPTNYASFSVFHGAAQVHNGRDKPANIDIEVANMIQFLADPGVGGTNAYTPIGAYAISTNSFLVIGGSIVDSELIDISAQRQEGVWADNPEPDTATRINMSMVTNIHDTQVMGLGQLRGKLLVCFRNGVAIGELGFINDVTIGTDTIKQHEPDFKDNVSAFGTISHRSIADLGNDVLMCDRVGIPSFSLSQISNQIVPQRVSDLVGPALQINLARLSDFTLQNKCFAVYNVADQQYMLFMPKYDPLDDVAPSTIELHSDLPANQFVLQLTDHGMDVGDHLDISFTAFGGFSGTSDTVEVVAIIDRDTILVQASTITHNIVTASGGGDITATRWSDEVGAYILTYNPKENIRSWSRYRGLDFTWGARSSANIVFFGNGTKVYRFGNKSDTITTDEGRPIEFVWEWPWGDFDQRLHTKVLKAIAPDAQGKASFKIEIFGDLLYKDKYGRRTPLRSMDFKGADARNTAPIDRRTLEPYIWPVPVNGKLIKFRISGSTIEELRFVSLSMIYAEGSLKR